VTFGLFLVRLDVRQDSSRHTAAHDRNHRLPGPGSLRRLGRRQRISFLMRNWQPSPAAGAFQTVGRHRRSARHLQGNRRRAGRRWAPT
jgi:hypothetical protein